MTTNTDRREVERRKKGITFGVILIALGVLMLGDQLRIGFDPLGIRVNVGNLWPLILIVIGGLKIANPGADGRRAGGYWLLFLGGMFLMHTYDVLALSQSWPLFIVAAGVSTVLSARDCDRQES